MTAAAAAPLWADRRGETRKKWRVLGKPDLLRAAPFSHAAAVAPLVDEHEWLREGMQMV
jgi:hypothetical protein